MLTTIVKTKAWPELFLLFDKKQPEKHGRPDSSPADEWDTKQERAILCRSCRSEVTSLNREISIHGKHMHTFFNPAGIVYEILCFSKASGCVTHGKPTDEFTWFPGYTWEYSLCASCLDHLGWFFNSSGDSFFGLINGKLIVGEPLS